MKRRQFIKITGAGVAAGLIGNSSLLSAASNRSTDLSYHRITDIKFTTIRLNYPRLVGKNSHLDVHGTGIESEVHILYSDKGASGWGLNRDSKEFITGIFNSMKGKTMGELIDPLSGIVSPFETFDFSLFDLAGKILDRPVYRLLGKRKPVLSRCYSGMIYFDDLEPADKPAGVQKILEECQYDYDYGYRQFKLKIGRGYKWMEKEKGLMRDIEVTKQVSKNFPDCDILVDGNNGFTLDEFLRYLEGIEGVRLYWIEEPFHETINDYAMLNSWLKVHNERPLLADGESNPDENVLQNLGSQNIIRVFLQDISGYGFTSWIKKIQKLKLMGLMASPHTWGSALKTNYTAHLAGAFGTIPTIEGVTCTSDDVDLTDYRIKKGKLLLSAKPGFGMDLIKKP